MSLTCTCVFEKKYHRTEPPGITFLTLVLLDNDRYAFLFAALHIYSPRQYPQSRDCTLAITQEVSWPCWDHAGASLFSATQEASLSAFLRDLPRFDLFTVPGSNRIYYSPACPFIYCCLCPKCTRTVTPALRPKRRLRKPIVPQGSNPHLNLIPVTI